MSRADLGDPEIKTAFEDVKSGKLNWFLLGYVPKSDTKLKVAESGMGGMKELSDCLNDGKNLFGLIAFDINKTRKFVYISWCGEGVTGMKKGLFNGHSQDVGFFFKGFHVQVNARNEKDVKEEAIVERLKKASGASYDSGAKVQGSAKLVPQSVSQGRQQASQSNLKQKSVDKSDYNKKDESSNYWNQDREEVEKAKQQQQTTPTRVTEYNKTQEREQFWANQKEEPKPAQKAVAAPKKVAATAPPREAPSAPKPEPQPEPEEPAPQEEAPPVPQEEPYQEEPYQEEPPQETPQETPQEVPQPEESSYQQEAPAEEQPQYSEEAPASTGGSGLQCKAVYDYNAENPDDLSFKEGDIISILDQSDPSGWWQGELNGAVGFFPSNFVEQM